MRVGGNNEGIPISAKGRFIQSFVIASVSDVHCIYLAGDDN